MESWRAVTGSPSTMASSPPERSLERAREITQQLKGLEKEVNRLKTGGGSSAVETLIQNARKVRDITLVVGTLEGYKQSDLRGISDRIRERTKRCVILLGSVDGGKAAIVVTVTRDLEGTKLDASRLASDLAKTLGGSGGGRRDFAQAGGRDSGKLDAALKRGQDLVQKQLG